MEAAPTIHDVADQLADSGLLDQFIEETPEEAEEAAAAEPIEEAPVIEEVSEVLEEEAAEAPEETPISEEAAEEEDPTEETELLEAIQAPVSMSKEHVELFKVLPPDQQKFIVERESQRDKGLQAKMTENAEVRKAAEVAYDQAEQERQHYARSLDVMLSKGLPPKPGADLLDPLSNTYDPDKFHLENAKHDAAMQDRQQLLYQADQTKQQQFQADNQKYTAFVNEQNTILAETLPEWNTNPTIKQDILSYATTAGYLPDQLKGASAVDIVTLNKAMAYDKIMAATPGVQEKIKQVPKVVKSGNKGGKASKYDAIAARKAKLAKTGSADDAVAAILDLL